MTTLIGIIQKDGKVKSGKTFFLMPFRGTDKEGYPEVLVDATSVGGESEMVRQSIKPYIGMEVEFQVHNGFGFNYKIGENKK
jgi:hypothetical protein